MYLFRLAVTVAASLLSGAALAQTADPDAIAAARPPVGQRAMDHWSPSAMSAAQLFPKLNVNPDAVRAAGAARSRASVGQPGATEAMEAEATSNVKERKSGNINTMPLVFAGKLFFSKSDGDYVCSAQFISKRILLTAAHCVRDDVSGDFYNNIVFALQYDKGRHGGAYDYECAATLNGWVQPGDAKYTYDFAMILVKEDSKTGWFGTQWNWAGLYNTATKIGYPGGILNGQVIQVDAGPISIEDGIVELRHGNPAEQGGSSGGGWVGDYSAASGNFNHIISVESFGYEGQPGVDYGPYFDNRLKILWDYMNNGCR